MRNVFLALVATTCAVSNGLAQNPAALNTPLPTPKTLSSADEDFASAKNATEADLRTDLLVWTSMVDIEKERAANRLKKFGENVDIDARLSPLLHRDRKSTRLN